MAKEAAVERAHKARLAEEAAPARVDKDRLPPRARRERIVVKKTSCAVDLQKHDSERSGVGERGRLLCQPT